MKKKFLSWNIANTTTKLESNFISKYLTENNQSIQKKFAKHLESKVESYNIGSKR